MKRKALAAFALVVAAGWFTAAPPCQAVEAGDPAPAFVVKDEQGRSVSLDEYRNLKHILLVFYIGYS